VAMEIQTAEQIEEESIGGDSEVEVLEPLEGHSYSFTLSIVGNDSNQGFTRQRTRCENPIIRSYRVGGRRHGRHNAAFTVSRRSTQLDMMRLSFQFSTKSIGLFGSACILLEDSRNDARNLK